MRVHTTSRDLDPFALAPGSDLVLELDEAHGLDLPHGVLVDDHLSIEGRRAVDREALRALAEWRGLHDESLTVDGVCLPHLHEWALLAVLVRAGRAVAGLRRAIDRHHPPSVVVAGADAHTRAVAVAAAERSGVAVLAETDVTPSSSAAARRPEPLGRRVRRGAIDLVTNLGVPSVLRRDSVVVVSYWPLTPLLDRMLDEGTSRPAVLLAKRPAGPSRILRTAARGGWVGLPSPRRVRRAAVSAADAFRAVAGGTARPLDLFGCSTGDFLHSRLLDLLRPRAGADLAAAATLRRAFGRGRVTRVVGCSDVEGEARLVVTLAREAGIPVLLIAHGAYLLPQALPDM